MKTEKILLLCIAVIIGLCVAGVGFYLYENNKVLSPAKLKTISLSPSVTPASSIPLVVDNPRDESTTDTRIVSITGRTNPDATVVITTPSSDQVISPVSTGAFSSSITIDSGENLVKIISISPTGEETEKDIVVTYTTENF